jgi:alanyl-tRNA synthetase
MDYAKTPDGDIVPLSRANVDTGMGLERTLIAINGLRSVYEIDTVQPLYSVLRQLATTTASDRDLRVLTDHLRAACFIIADGVVPSSKDRGYVLRRLLRRCLCSAQQLGMPHEWYRSATPCLPGMFEAAYPELSDLASIETVIAEEVERFQTTLAHGLRIVAKQTVLDGAVAFDLFQTYGFPFELTRELAARQGKHVDEAGFRAQLDRHRELSRSRSAGTFEGGLADHSVAIVRYHTLTHLLQAALRVVLGEHVMQRGSNLTHERLRFDFSHSAKLTPAELARVEQLVNDWLHRDWWVESSTMTQVEARALGALGAFGEKYGEIVSVHTIVERDSGEVISREFCGGPHVQSVHELRGRFRIVKQQAIAAGIRRIKAVLEQASDSPWE